MSDFYDGPKRVKYRPARNVESRDIREVKDWTPSKKRGGSSLLKRFVPVIATLGVVGILGFVFWAVMSVLELYS